MVRNTDTKTLNYTLTDSAGTAVAVTDVAADRQGFTANALGIIKGAIAVGKTLFPSFLVIKCH